MWRRFVIILAMSALPVASVHAIPITMQFAVTGFFDAFGNSSPPTDPVNGTIVFDAASVNSTINSLTSISMTIDGHAYSVGDLSFASLYSGNLDIIYATLNGISLVSGTNDFLIAWDRSTLDDGLFGYSTSNDQDSFFVGTTFSSFSVTSNQIPEPGTLILLGFGLAGLAASRRRRQ